MQFVRPVQLGFCRLVCFAAFLRQALAYTKTYVMEEHCDDLIDMQYSHLSMVHVLLTDHSVYRRHTSCSFAVRAPPGYRLIMVIEWMDIAVGRFSGCADYLSVRERELNRTGLTRELDAKLCGNEAPPTLASRGQLIALHFDSNTLENGAGFSIVFTAFHEGECRTHDEFRCDNGRCIDKRLKCDEYDNCGDASDDCILSVGDVVIAVVVTTILFLLIVGTAVLYCHRDKLKIRKKCPVIGANPDGVYQPTTQPARTKISRNEATTAV